jgi:hypothetical protein
MQASRLISAILVAIAVAVTTCFALVASDGGFRSGVARLVRCGAQRLDSTDALCHDHEHPGPVVAASSAPESSATDDQDGAGPADLARLACAAAPHMARASRSLNLAPPIGSRPIGGACGRAPPVS